MAPAAAYGDQLYWNQRYAEEVREGNFYDWYFGATLLCHPCGQPVHCIVGCFHPRRLLCLLCCCNTCGASAGRNQLEMTEVQRRCSRDAHVMASIGYARPDSVSGRNSNQVWAPPPVSVVGGCRVRDPGIAGPAAATDSPLLLRAPGALPAACPASASHAASSQGLPCAAHPAAPSRPCIPGAGAVGGPPGAAIQCGGRLCRWGGHQHAAD